MDRLNDANFIKALLIDFLINQDIRGGYLFGSEIFFGSKKRQTDLLTLNGTITAFEIKASNDDFRNVREQLNDYKKVFDYQFLVVTKTHEKKAKNILTPQEGLMVVDNNLDIKIVKNACLIKKQMKSEILETMPQSFLKKKYKLPKQLSAFEAREFLLKRKLTELKDSLKLFFELRLTPRNSLFISEKGETTHFEDIKLLTKPANQFL